MNSTEFLNYATLWGALTVHHWKDPALQYFGPKFLSTTVICFRLTPANNSYWLFIFLGPFNILGLDLLLLKDTSLQLRFLNCFVLLTLSPLLSWLLGFMLFTFDNSDNCFFFIVAVNSSKQVLCLHITFLSSTRHIMILQALFPSPSRLFCISYWCPIQKLFFYFIVFMNSSI